MGLCRALRQFAVSVANGWRGARMEFARRWRLAFRVPRGPKR